MLLFSKDANTGKGIVDHLSIVCLPRSKVSFLYQIKKLSVKLQIINDVE